MPSVLIPLVTFLCAPLVHGVLEGTCPRKEAPPGVLVIFSGSNLTFDCKGHVVVDGVKVNISPSGSVARFPKHSTARPGGASENTTPPPSTATAHNTPPAAAHALQPTGDGGGLEGESHREPEGEDDYGDGEEEASRVTRATKARPEWTWNGRTVGTGSRDWGEMAVDRCRSALSLSSVRVADSGRYSCHLRGRERFSLKVVVAEHPERPNLSCHKKSPSSKIRCAWDAKRPSARALNCTLVLKKRPSNELLRLRCSYSSRRSRCWCALDHNEDEQRTLHVAYLCATSVGGTAASGLLHFIPMNILKPDPPSNVTAKQEEGQETRLRVTWNYPTSWKPQDKFYKLIYQIKYRPLESSAHQEQIKIIGSSHSYTIADAMPGVEYLVQLRTKEEYDGQWGDWSAPVNASSWTAQKLSGDVMTTEFPFYIEEGSASGEDMADAVSGPVEDGVEVSPHVLWISGSFVVLAVVLAAYMFRHKDRFLSKLHQVSFLPPARPTPTPATPEQQGLVAFTPPCSNEAVRAEAGEEEGGEEENRTAKDATEALHFNNTSYFFTQGQ